MHEQELGIREGIAHDNPPLSLRLSHGHHLGAAGVAVDRSAGMNFRLTMPVAMEAEEQAALMAWAAAATRTYPPLRWLAAIPNGLPAASLNAARRMKQQGMKAGVPDLLLPYPWGGYHGLWIELKRRHGGQLSQEQRQWIDYLNRVGYRAEVCCGWNAARETLLAYLDAPARTAAPVAPF